MKIDGQKSLFSPKKISSIHIATSAALSTDAIKLALDNNIDIVFLDDFHGAYARVWFPRIGSTVKIRRKQLEISETQRGFCLAKEWMLKKVDNQLDVLRELGYKRPAQSELFKSALEFIADTREKILKLEFSESAVPTIMGLEGNISRKYFEVLSIIMPKGYEFNGRSRQPAVDRFNCLLNYGYGVLYSIVDKACIIAGLDPHIGFMHTDNYNKKSLVFDIIEIFRVYADLPVVHLCTGKRFSAECFDNIENGITLNKAGKKEFLTHYYKHLDEKIRHRNRQVSRKTAIQLECHHIAQQLLKEGKAC